MGAAQDEAALRSRVVDEATGLKALSGSGSKEYPYVLSSPEALAWFANKANTLHAAAITNTKGVEDPTFVAAPAGITYDSAYANLGANIDLLGAAYGGSVNAAGATSAEKYAKVLDWTPIGQKIPHFDGQGHTIDHLYINAPASDYQGLFGYSESPFGEGYSFVRNTSVGNASYVHGNNRVGAIMGGTDNADAVNCSNAGEIVAEGNDAAGIVGYSDSGDPSACTNTGNVTSSDYAAGIVATGDCAVYSSSNTGAITATAADGFASGIAVGPSGSFESCYNAGPIKAAKPSAIASYVSASYNCLYDKDASTPAGAAAPVTGGREDADAHGRAEGVSTETQLNRLKTATNNDGMINETIETNVANMTVWRQATGDASAGTLENNGYPVLCAIDATDASGNVAASLQAADTWADVGAWVDTFIVAGELDNALMPYADPADGTPLNFKPDTSTGAGSASAKALKFTTPEAFAWFAYKANTAPTENIPTTSTPYAGAYIALGTVGSTTALDLTGAPYGGSLDATPGATQQVQHQNALAWSSIGADRDHPFTGDVMGYVAIDHLRVRTDRADGTVNNAGLFGYVGNASLTYVNITSGYVGADSGSTTAIGNVGALVGESVPGSLILRGCSNAADVSANGANAGALIGLCGSTTVTVNECFNTGSVQAASSAGGLVGAVRDGVASVGGSAQAAFANCFNTGSVAADDGKAAGAFGTPCPASARCGNIFYDSTVAPADATVGTAAKSTAQFASGEVTWMLNAVASYSGVFDPDNLEDSGTWRQHIARDASTGELQTTGDPLPLYGRPEDGTTTVGRATFVAPPPLADTYAYVNDDSKLALPAGYSSYHLDTATGTSITSPYTVPNDGSAYDFKVYLGEGAIDSWAAVGAAQNEATLRATDVSGVSGLKALSGAGSEANPYVLSTPEAFAWFANQVNTQGGNGISNTPAPGVDDPTFEATAGTNTEWDGTVVPITYGEACASLGADIDLLGAAYGGAADESKTTAAEKYADVLDWVPINQGKLHFDGLGHTVDHLYINATANDDTADYQGLFGSVKSGFVRNTSVGAKSYVHGRNRVGAVVAYAGDPLIENCSNAGEVSGSGMYIGGVFGGTDDAFFLGSSNTGNVSGATYVGGVVGYMGYDMANCYNTGSVTATATDGYAGGIAGSMPGNAASCYNAGSVSAAKAAAIVPSDNYCTNCFFDPVASTPSGTTTLSGTLNGSGGSDDAPGEVEAVSADVLKSWGAAYQLSRITLVSDDSGYYEKAPVADLANMTVWRMAKADDGTGNPENNGYPVLIAVDGEGFEQDGTTPTTTMQKATDWAQVGAWVETFDPTTPAYGTSGTTTKIKPAPLADTFTITTPEGLAWFAYKASIAPASETISAGSTKHYSDVPVKLGNDIDLLGDTYGGSVDSTEISAAAKYAGALDWSPINQNTPDFDGQGHTVDHLYINAPTKDYQGLIGKTDGGDIRNTSIGSEGYVHGNNNVGALAGYHGGTITNCSNAAEVAGEGGNIGGVAGSVIENITACSNTAKVAGKSENVGGVAGYARGDIIRCSNTGDVNGAAQVGGVSGYNDFSVMNCSNTGSVTGTTKVGGIVGYCDSSFDNCFNTGAVTATDADGQAGGIQTFGTGGFANCYNVGPVKASKAAAMRPNMTDDDCYNCFYDKDASTPAGAAAPVTGGTDVADAHGRVEGVSTEAMKSWGAAYQLNRLAVTDAGGYTPETNLANMTTWRHATGDQAAGTLENNGYPVLIALDSAAADGTAGDRMQTASSWSQVGHWVDAFLTADELDNARVPYADPADGTLLGYKPEMSATSDGSAADKAIQLSNPEQLAWWAYSSTGYASLAGDIDLFGTPYTGVAAGANNIGDALSWTNDTTGTSLDGGKRTVTHMNATNGLLTNAFSLRDLTLADGLVDASGQSAAAAGAFASTGASGATFVNLTNKNVAVRGSGDAGSYAGGIVGLGGDDSAYVLCANQAGVSAAERAGGIVGFSSGSSATASSFGLSSNTGAIDVSGVDGSTAAGIGSANYLNMEACFNTGSVAAKNNAAGLSFVGNRVPLTGSYNAGAVAATNAFPVANKATATNTYHNSTLADATGAVHKDDADMKADAFAEALDSTLSVNNAQLAGINLHDYSWKRTAGTNGDYPYLTAARQYSSWEDVGAVQNEAMLRAQVVTGSDNGYALSGSGTLEKPYVISSPEALAWYAYQVNTKKTTVVVNTPGVGVNDPMFEISPTYWGSFGSRENLDYKHSCVQLGADIDLLGEPYGGSEDLSKGTAAEKYAGVLDWVPIQQRTPNLDGKGHTIDHLYINSSANNQGLYGGYLDASYEIKCSITNTSIGANSYVHGNNNVGSLVGSADDVYIVNCSNAGTVEGESKVGGIAGINNGSLRGGITIGCSNTGTITSTTFAGGIVGSENSNIANCFNAGAVSATAVDGQAGGIISSRSPGVDHELVNCYNVGPVSAATAGAITSTSNGSIYNCFYNTETSTPAGASTVTGLGSGGDVPCQVEGLTTDELKSWGAAYQLNRVSCTLEDNFYHVKYANENNVANMTAWRQATGDEAAGTLENKGYPVPCAPGETMQAAADWRAVGEWVDTFITVGERENSRKPLEYASGPGANPPGELLNYKPDTSVNDGSAADKAIELSTPEALAWWALVNRATGKYVAMTTDMDLFGTPYTGVAANLVTSTDWGAPSNIEDGLLWKSPDTTKAHVDGRGNTIKHMHAFSGLLYQALEVRDLTMAEGLVDATGGFGTYAGAFSSESARDATFTNLVNQSVAVRGSGGSGDCAAGIVGQSSGSSVFVGCVNQAPVSNAEYYTGGIVGRNYSGTPSFYLCANEGTVDGTNASTVSGIGHGDAGVTAEACYNTGSVVSSASATGLFGVSGSNAAVVAASYNAGAVTAPTAFQIAKTFTGTDTYYNSSLAAGAGTGTAEGKLAADMKTTGFVSTLDRPLAASTTTAAGINLSDFGWVRADGTNGGFPYLASRARDNWAAVGAEQDEAALRATDVSGATASRRFRVRVPKRAPTWFPPPRRSHGTPTR